MSVRGAALVGGWLLGVALATTVSWAGVRLVGDEVAPTGAGSLSQAEVERRIHQTSTPSPTSPEMSPSALNSPRLSPSSSPSSSPASSRPAPPSSRASHVPASRKSVASAGGTVVFECTGSTITARFSPTSGFAGEQDSDHSGKIEVTFRSANHRSKIEGSCRGGVITTSVEESAHREDD